MSERSTERCSYITRFAPVGAVLTLLVTLAFLEGACRILARYYPVLEPSTLDGYDRFRAKPYSLDYGFRLNSKGFKDVEFPMTKASGTIRVAAVGDSFAFGVVPYPDNFLTLTEARLKEAGEQVEILNMGIPGIGVEEYSTLISQEALPLRPDVVLLLFFVGNDFDVSAPWKPSKELYLVHMVKLLSRFHERFEGRIVHSAETYDDGSPVYTQSAFDEMETFRARIFRRDYGNFRTQLKWTLSQLEHIKKICAQENVKLLLVALPDELQVSQPLQREVLERNKWSSDEVDFLRPNRALEDWMPRLGVEYTDFLKPFAEKSASLRLYRPRDSHWNIEGNKLGAALLTDWLRARIHPSESSQPAAALLPRAEHPTR